MVKNIVFHLTRVTRDLRGIYAGFTRKLRGFPYYRGRQIGIGSRRIKREYSLVQDSSPLPEVVKAYRAKKHRPAFGARTP